MRGSGEGTDTELTRRAYDTVAASYARLLPDTGYESDLDRAMVRRFVELLREASRTTHDEAVTHGEPVTHDAPAPRAEPAQHDVRGGRDLRDVLDAGCGAGRMIAYLTALDPALAITGLDLSPAMLALARDAHPEASFVQGELEELPFPDESFDGVLAWYSIIHTPPSVLPQVFAEFARVLRPGGAVLLGFQLGEGERWLAHPYGHDVELNAFLHDTAAVSAGLVEAGLTAHALLDRGPRPSERLGQGFVLAVRPVAVSSR